MGLPTAALVLGLKVRGGLDLLAALLMGAVDIRDGLEHLGALVSSARLLRGLPCLGGLRRPLIVRL